MLPEIVYNVKKKLGCKFVEKHNLEPMGLKRGLTMGLVTLCVVTQEEQGQAPAERCDATQSIGRTSYDTDTHTGGASVDDTEKAGWKADSVQSIESRQSYETKEEKCQFICESFELDTNKILNSYAKLKEAVIKLFVDNFEDLDTHPSQYGETKVLEMKMDFFQSETLEPRS